MVVFGSITLADAVGFLPIGIGCLVGAAALAALKLGGVRKKKGVIVLNRVASDPDDAQSFSDRRGSLRREGRAVKVLARSQSLKTTEAGYVLDRSTGGLRLALGLPVPAGAAVELRAKNAPDSTPWVTVIVRSCRNAGNHHELGCEFDSTPPWNVLLLFG